VPACLVSFALFAVLLGALVHLVEEELVGAGEVALERLAGRERVARVEAEVAGVEVGRPRQTQLQPLNLRLQTKEFDETRRFSADTRCDATSFHRQRHSCVTYWRGVVVSGVRRMNEVNARRARFFDSQRPYSARKTRTAV